MTMASFFRRRRGLLIKAVIIIPVLWFLAVMVFSRGPQFGSGEDSGFMPSLFRGNKEPPLQPPNFANNNNNPVVHAVGGKDREVDVKEKRQIEDDDEVLRRKAEEEERERVRKQEEEKKRLEEERRKKEEALKFEPEQKKDVPDPNGPGEYSSPFPWFLLVSLTLSLSLCVRVTQSLIYTPVRVHTTWP